MYALEHLSSFPSHTCVHISTSTHKSLYEIDSVSTEYDKTTDFCQRSSQQASGNFKSEYNVMLNLKDLMWIFNHIKYLI